MAIRKDYLFKRDGRTLLMLDPDTLEEVGRFETPENFTMAEAETVFRVLLAEARKREIGPS